MKNVEIDLKRLNRRSKIFHLAGFFKGYTQLKEADELIMLLFEEFK